jgi:phospholipid/cholesterol/gamma-HCH transport system substrate-binding protein
MPRTRSLAWSQLKIGILAITALMLATALVIAVGGQAGFWWQRYELYTKFADVKGLKKGAVVRVAGIDVGKVSSLEFSGPDVQVKLSIKKAVQSRITDRSRATIGSLSLLGEPIIDIVPSAAGTPLGNGAFIPSAKTSGQIADVASSASDTLDQVRALVTDIRAGKGTAGKLLSDDALYKDLTALLASAQDVTDAMNKGHGTIGQLLRDPGAYRQLNDALANLNDATRRINAGEGTIGRLLTDDAMAKSFTSAAENVDAVTGALRKGDGTMGKLLTDRELFDRFNSLAARLDHLTASLEQGQGTAGQLLQNKALYENMNSAVNDLKSLIGDIRKDPRKYLNVKVSIF